MQHESHLKTGVTPRCPEAYAARMTQFLKVEIQAIEILVTVSYSVVYYPTKGGVRC